MVRGVAAGLLAALLVGVPAPLDAWGLEIHRLITRRAIDGLPAELKPFFAVQRDFIIEHSVDPDEWRVVGLSGALGGESANHQLDLDALDDAPPFRNVPRDWNAFVAKYGLERANRAGRLPWRTQEIYDRLVATFKDIGKPTAPYAADNVRYLAAVLSHYVADAHVPLHATANYDGQMTNQRGIHSRFETELAVRSVANLKLAPVTVGPTGSVRDFVFDTLRESQSLVTPILEADRRALDGRESYDDVYFAAFAKGARPILERRLGDASSAVASVIVSAWGQAGKLPLTVDHTKMPARIRR
jgi:hypothetical protein